MPQTQSRFWLILLICSVFWSGAAFAATPPAIKDFPDIKVRDQFKIEHSVDSLFSLQNSTGPLVLIAGDQRRSDRDIQDWVNLLKESLGNRVQYIGLANLRGLPFFVSKNSVRSSLKKRMPDVPVLCDWKGEAFKQFAFVSRQQNVHVYSIERKLIGSVTGKASAETAKAVAELVERASAVSRMQNQ